MKKIFLIIIILLFLTSKNCLAGFSSYKESYATDTAVASVYIKDQGIFNLVIKIQFLHEPYDKKPYTTDAYKNYINRLSVEWSEIATQNILSSNISNIKDIEKLRNDIKTGIGKRAELLKGSYSLTKKDEFIYSITGIYLVKPE
ncbi:MAG: hypothetical protein CR997_14445 [Acidobacteria bacterium]|nr:MAG: hypothetical protein CR997_14445 [Acidobacteriota bacterium]